jgi:hypothetical protein
MLFAVFEYGWMGTWTQRPSLGTLEGMPPMARRPPARGCEVVARRRAREKTGGMDGFWKLFRPD